MPAIDRESRRYLVLGIHGTANIHGGRVARVRMFVDGNAVDEDFPLPRTPSVEDQIDELITARIAELAASPKLRK